MVVVSKMCGIAGVISKSGKNVVPTVRIMLSCMVHRGPDGAGIVADGHIAKSDSIAALDIEGIRGRNVLGHTRLAIVGGTCGAQPFQSCDGRFTLEHNGEIYNYKALRADLEASKNWSHKFQTQTDSEVIVHILEENFEGSDLVEAVRKTVAMLDGVYALAIRDEVTGETVLVRDRLGVRQLYYADRPEFFAFASEKKALWAVGIAGPISRVMPCEGVLISKAGDVHRFAAAEQVPVPRRITYRTMSSAVKAYKKAFIQSMQKRTQDFNKIGIIFSGGIDSVLVAQVAAMMVPNVACYTCGVKGSSDTTFARHIAEKLGLELKVCELDENEVERILPEVINTIEDTNVGQVEVAIPVYGAVKLARDDGMKVMLTGQAADELFGGYSWYSKLADKEGFLSLRKHMLEDLSLLYKETLEREDKITMANSIELREPFLDPEVIRVALSMNLRLNVRDGSDLFGKRVHRNLAREFGIPKDIAYRIKEAAQHGSGMHGMLDSIARKHGFDEGSVRESYIEMLQKRERIGSSQRYGYLFGDEKIWTAEPHVQMYLDSIAEKLSLFDQVCLLSPTPARAPAAMQRQIRDRTK